MEQIRRLLEEYGLEQKEIIIYLSLVENGRLTAYELARQTHLHRSSVYDVLERLLVKGFVQKEEQDNKWLFAACDTSALLAKVKDQENLLLTLQQHITHYEQHGETRVRILENGLKQFDLNLFSLVRDKKITYVYLLGNSEASTLSANIFIKRLLEEVRKKKLHKKIDYRALWNTRFKNTEVITSYTFLGNNKFLDGLPSCVLTILFDGFVGFVHGTEKPNVIEIKNKDIAREMKWYFEQLWKNAVGCA